MKHLRWWAGFIVETIFVFFVTFVVAMGCSSSFRQIVGVD